MSEDRSTMTTDSEAPNSDSSHTARHNGESKSTVTFWSRDVRTLLDYAALALFVLFAVVAVVQLYSAVGNTITQLISPEYRALFSAAFNLTVLLVCVGGISMQLKRIT